MVFIHEIAFQNIVCEISAISFRPECVGPLVRMIRLTHHNITSGHFADDFSKAFCSVIIVVFYSDFTDDCFYQVIIDNNSILSQIMVWCRQATRITSTNVDQHPSQHMASISRNQSYCDKNAVSFCLQDPCRVGYTYFYETDSCYKFDPVSTMTWDDARTVCLSEGADLLAHETPQELDLISSWITPRM